MASLILGTLAMFVLGIGLWCGLPILAHFGPDRLAQAAMRARTRTALRCFGRGLLIDRDGGKPLFKKTVMPDVVPGEAARVNGDSHVWFDPRNAMGLWHGRPFGTTHLDTAVITDPVLCHLGQLLEEKDQQGRLETDGGRFAMFVGVDEDETPVVSPANAKAILQGSVPPKAIDLVETYVEKAQAGWNTTAVLDFMQLLISLGGGVGIGWGMLKLLSSLGGGGGGTTIPLWMGVLPL